MNRNMTLLLIPLVAAACGPAATVDRAAMDGIATAQLESNATLLPVGTEIRVRVDNPLGITGATASGAFRAEVIEPVVSATGETLVPRGAQVSGTVIHSRGTLAPSPEVIGVNPERLEVDGATFEIAARVVEVDVALSDDDADTPRPGRAAYGTPSSMIPGTIIDDAEAFLVENELGPNPGTVISVGTSTGASLPAGTRLTLAIISDEVRHESGH